VQTHDDDKTAISITAVRDGKFVRIIVSDDGPGLPDVIPANLFDRFYRGSSDASGAGLGLAICKGIVTAHGGTISARSRPERGAEFAFMLPVADVPTTPEDDEESTPR
jgi:two-component system sensor histidine kinase KdpD